MTRLNNTTRSRKFALGLGALAVSLMTMAGAAQAKPKFQLQLHFGNGGLGGVSFGTGHFGHGWNYCDKYWFKYEHTGKFKYKKKYMKCMGYW